MKYAVYVSTKDGPGHLQGTDSKEVEGKYLVLMYDGSLKRFHHVDRITQQEYLEAQKAVATTKPKRGAKK